MLQSSPTYEYFTRIYPPDTTSARLLVHLLYNSRAFAGWNNVAVVHQDDAWGKGYVTEMELELRRINSKIPLREPDREPGTLLPFAITHTDSDSVKRALDAVNSSGYSVIVVVGHFLPPFLSTFEDFLEACLATPTPRPRLRLSPHLCDCAAQPAGYTPRFFSLPFSCVVAASCASIVRPVDGCREPTHTLTVYSVVGSEHKRSGDTGARMVHRRG